MLSLVFVGRNTSLVPLCHLPLKAHDPGPHSAEGMLCFSLIEPHAQFQLVVEGPNGNV